jgi:hypothetical protein
MLRHGVAFSDAVQTTIDPRPGISVSKDCSREVSKR